MPVDINLDPSSHDIDISKGIILNTEGSPSLAQKVKIALLLRTNEWPENINVGVPYSQSILSSKNNKTLIDSYLQSYILNIPEVDRLTRFSSEVTTDRKYSMKFSASSNNNDTTDIEVLV